MAVILVPTPTNTRLRASLEPAYTILDLILAVSGAHEIMASLVVSLSSLVVNLKSYRAYLQSFSGMRAIKSSKFPSMLMCSSTMLGPVVVEKSKRGEKKKGKGQSERVSIFVANAGRGRKRL